RSSRRRRARPSSIRPEPSALNVFCSSSKNRETTMGMKPILAVLAATALPAEAQQTQSRLFEITKSHKLRVCQFPLYYSISYRDPKTGEIKGIDADLAKELAKELDAKLEIVESSFAT